ncbi:hypothetical protein PROFUN_12273 [Planoprotostelium fungivorum]|uniref:Uncharacterized protein n=1 Tax=Planoprotostelium fungivorum TaxID=1890364 RepID=A0A2P6N7Q6_9EUKA|nr:hypothetical protein PROFUN_12273 [Planoprotostelium fungivorum]
MNLFAWPSSQVEFGQTQHSGTNLSRHRAPGSDHWCHAARQGRVSNQLGHWSCPTANPKLAARPNHSL